MARSSHSSVTVNLAVELTVGMQACTFVDGRYTRLELTQVEPVQEIVVHVNGKPSFTIQGEPEDLMQEIRNRINGQQRR